jgi:hypothetical protein
MDNSDSMGFALFCFFVRELISVTVTGLINVVNISREHTLLEKPKTCAHLNVSLFDNNV